ncbi:MAG: pyrimidine dimer DNA glycosylase/endonuclease V [Acidimicrobiales bacterium]
MDPALLCRKHLLGEHVECHMFRGSLLKGRSLQGFLASGLLDSRVLARRHDQLAKEMNRRGYLHASPLPRDFDASAAAGDVDVATALQELAARCEECRRLQSDQTSPAHEKTARRSHDIDGSSR